MSYREIKWLMVKDIIHLLGGYLGYVVIGGYMLLQVLLLLVLPLEYNIFDYGYAQVDSYFLLQPLLLMFLIPAITSRLITEEKKSHTMDILRLRFKIINIVIAKFLTAVLLFLIGNISVIAYIIMIGKLGSPIWNFDGGVVLGSLIGSFILIITLSSISLFIATLTSNSVQAFLMSVVTLLVVLYGFDMIGGVSLFTGINDVISYFSLSFHYGNFLKGRVTLEDILFFLSLIYVSLSLSIYFIKKVK